MSHEPILQHYLAAAQPYLDQYGYAAVFVGVGIEGFGIPAPGETLVIASGLLAAQGGLHIVPLALTAWSAAVIGDNIGYAIGRFGGRRLISWGGKYIGVRPQHLERVERLFRRYGGGVVASARFFDVLRQLNGLIAGTSGMPWWRFFAYDAFGAALWVALWGLGTYFVSRHLEPVLILFKRFEPYVIAAGLVALLSLIAYLLWRFQRRKKGNADG